MRTGTSQNNLLAAAICAKAVMNFRDANPRRPSGVFEARNSSSPSSPSVACNVNHIGASFCDTNSDGAYTLGGNELHDHTNTGSFRIMNELRQVFE